MIPTLKRTMKWTVAFCLSVGVVGCSAFTLYETYPSWATVGNVYRVITWGILLICLRQLNRLLLIGQQDRIAREIALLELKMKTYEIAEQVQKRASELDKKVDSNTATTEEVLKHVTNGGHK